MLRVTWEWLGSGAALDLANTVAVVYGVERDLLEPDGEYQRWVVAAATSSPLEADAAAAIVDARPRILALREPIREVLFAVAAGDSLPGVAVAELNRVSRRSPLWAELSPEGRTRERAAGGAVDRLLATYARSAIEVANDGATRLRVCPAPSCGMLFRPGRSDQRWCSLQCGTRARVAQHYRLRGSGGSGARSKLSERSSE
jgi:predicted RNA-binding Zn ribbon-like protein